MLVGNLDLLGHNLHNLDLLDDLGNQQYEHVRGSKRVSGQTIIP